MKNRKIRVVKKSIKSLIKREDVVIRCGSRLITIKFSIRRDGRVKGETTYRSDYAVPILRETSSIIQEVADV